MYSGFSGKPIYSSLFICHKYLLMLYIYTSEWAPKTIPGELSLFSSYLYLKLKTKKLYYFT